MKEKLNWITPKNGIFKLDNFKPFPKDEIGFVIIRKKFTKVTNVCYGQINDLLKKFKNRCQQNKSEFSFTYAVYELEDYETVLNYLIKSLYHNQDYIESNSKVNIPNFALFNDIYVEDYKQCENETEVRGFFEEYLKMTENLKLTYKVKCFLTKNRQTNKYFIFLKTLRHFELEYSIFNKFPGLQKGTKSFSEKYFEILDKFGEINDIAPNC